MPIGDRIRQRRKELGLTQVELGQRVHKSSQVISNWERGYTTGIAPEDLQRLAAALDASVQFFVPDEHQDIMPIIIKENNDAAYGQPDFSDQRLKSLIDAYPHLDEKSKDIIEAIIKLSNNDNKPKA